MPLARSAIEVFVNEEEAKLVLRGTLGVGDAFGLHQAALQLKNAGAENPDGSREPDAQPGACAAPPPSVQADLHEIEAADVAVLQILAALEAEFARQGRTFEVHLSAAIERQWQEAGWRGFARS